MLDGRLGPKLAGIRQRLARRKTGHCITRAGLDDKCKLCVEALNWYVSLYGAEAGNLALKMMAAGGVFIGGGIAPKIIHKLKEPTFLNGFRSKGQITTLFESVPVRVIMKDTTALLGAARVAAQNVCAA